MPEYIYLFTPGPRPDMARDLSVWTEEDLQVLEAHSAFLEDGAAAGTIILGGRSQDGIGPAIVIFEAADDASARAFMETDPFVSSGLFGASLHPFRSAFTRDS